MRRPGCQRRSNFRPAGDGGARQRSPAIEQLPAVLAQLAFGIDEPIERLARHSPRQRRQSRKESYNPSSNLRLAIPSPQRLYDRRIDVARVQALRARTETGASNSGPAVQYGMGAALAQRIGKAPEPKPEGTARIRHQDRAHRSLGVASPMRPTIAASSRSRLRQCLRRFPTVFVAQSRKET